MTIPTVTISGRIEVPGGATVRSGTLTVTLSDSASALDGAEAVAVASRQKFTIGRGGTVALAIPANDILTPAGTHYVAAFEVTLSDGSRDRWTQRWQVPSGGAIDIGAVPRRDVVDGIAVTVHESVQAGVLASATASAAAAAASETAAAGSEAASAASELAAEAARVAAEGARDAAVVGAGLAVDEPTGRLTVADGEAFRVQGSVAGDVALNAYRRINAGTPSTLVGEIPSTALVRKVTSVLHPRATDSAGHVAYVLDAGGRVTQYTDAALGIHVPGDTRTIQGAMLEQRLTAGRATDTAGNQGYELDAAGRVTRLTDPYGIVSDPGAQLGVGAVESLARFGAPRSTWSTLPAGFNLGMRPASGAERYVWAGMLPGHRWGANKYRWTAYPFTWPNPVNPVDPSMVRRKQATHAMHPSAQVWTPTALNVTLPGDWAAGGYQFRDISVLYDRKLGRYRYAINAIKDQASGWPTDRIALFESTNGIDITFVDYLRVGLSTGGSRNWSPEFFVDDDGTLYVIINANTTPSASFEFHLFRCDDPDSMVEATWAYVGKLTGTSFPKNVSGHTTAGDGFMFKRDGVYCVFWAAQSGSTTHPDWLRIGVSYSTSILGPYDQGAAFSDPDGRVICGEGVSVCELPPGSPWRFRVNAVNQNINTHRGRIVVDVMAHTNDFVTFSQVERSLWKDDAYYQHATAVLGL